MSGLAQAAHRLHPPERFFDAFALDRADAIAGMASRTRIDRRPAVGLVLRDVRRAAAFATERITRSGWSAGIRSSNRI
jgi:hypothetical protein